MKKGICYIVGAGECDRLLLYPQKEDMVIAVDGGYKYLEGQRIDLVVGDFDSLMYVPTHPRIIQLPTKKDDTDMMAAMKEGLRTGYEIFHIYGGTGGRLSHTIANIQCLAYLAEHGANGLLFGKQEVVTLLQNGSMTFDASYEGYLSVFAYGGVAKGVTLEGLKYSLKDYTLTQKIPLGVSNEFMREAAKVTVTDGALLLVYPKQKEADLG